MKPTSTQQNEDFKVGDDLYSLYLAEIAVRGYDYFNKLSNLPGIIGGEVNSKIIEAVLLQLACNKGITTLMLSNSPKSNIERVLFDGLANHEKDLLIDFLDDITLNVQLRNPELFNRNKQVLLNHLNSVVKHQTSLNAVDMENFNSVINFFDNLLVTYHYLRKIGIANALK